MMMMMMIMMMMMSVYLCKTCIIWTYAWFVYLFIRSFKRKIGERNLAGAI